MKSKINALKTLQDIPGVGKSIARDLRSIHVTSPEDLQGQNPEILYKKLCIHKGFQVDRCMLYVLRCAVYSVSQDQPRPELLKWWNWTDVRMKEFNQFK
jgi:hypothetical protein